MTEAIVNLINRSDPQAVILFTLLFGGGLIVGLVATICGFIHNFRKHESEMNLKHEMIARGMSAEEIERVLAATSTSAKSKSSNATGSVINVKQTF
jgi:hypothetical protein